jgi:hypothetical protein
MLLKTIFFILDVGFVESIPLLSFPVSTSFLPLPYTPLLLCKDITHKILGTSGCTTLHSFHVWEVGLQSSMLREIKFCCILITPPPPLHPNPPPRPPLRSPLARTFILNFLFLFRSAVALVPEEMPLCPLKSTLSQRYSRIVEFLILKKKVCVPPLFFFLSPRIPNNIGCTDKINSSTSPAFMHSVTTCVPPISHISPSERKLRIKRKCIILSRHRIPGSSLSFILLTKAPALPLWNFIG